MLLKNIEGKKLFSIDILNKFLFILIALYCFFSGAQVYNASYSIITGLVIIAIILSCLGNIKYVLYKMPKEVYWALGIFLTCILTASIAIGDIRSVKKSLIFGYWMLPLFFIYLLNNRKLHKISINVGLHSALFVTSSSAIIEFLKIHRRVDGIYGQPNHLASMLDLLLPFCIMSLAYVYSKTKNKLLVAVLSVNVIAGLYALHISGSRGGLLGVVLGLVSTTIIYIVKNYKLKNNRALYICVATISILSICSLGVSLANMKRGYDYERVALVKSSYNMWKDHKIVGVGVANWAYEYQNKYILPEAKEPKLDMPHNVFAYFFSTSGIIGGFGYCVCMIILTLVLIRNLNIGNWYCIAMLWALFAINLHGCVDVGLTLKSAARLFYMCLGIALAEIVNTRNISRGKDNDKL